MGSRTNDFKAAVEIVGPDWLEDKESEFYDDEENQDHLRGENPPKIAQLYHIAKEDIQGDRDGPLNFPKLREDTVRFLRVGNIYSTVKDAPVISPDGDTIDEKSVVDLYQRALRDDEQFQSALFEIETGAEYKARGHNPGFVDEDLTTSKSPDIELLDLEERVQIECKRCRAKSDQDRVLSNRLNVLFHKLMSYIDASYIVLIELDRIPEESEVATIESYLPEEMSVSRKTQNETDLPFGTLHSLPFYKEGIIEQPIYDLEGAEITYDFFELFVRPILSARLGIDKAATELGDWQLHSDFQSTTTTGFYKSPFWIGVASDKWSSAALDRVRNQFKGVSRKFDDCPSILQIFFPEFREGDALQDLRLRRFTGGELKVRPEISGVVITGETIQKIEGGVQVETPTMFIPNYSPRYPLPENLNLIHTDLDQAIAHDEVRTSANEELMADPQGWEKAIEQKEGTISFRFTPQESSDVDSAATITSIDSLNGEVSVELEVLPGSVFRLTRERGHREWISEIDGTSLPDFEPIHFFIIWSENETKLVISPEGSDNQLVSVCDTPIER